MESAKMVIVEVTVGAVHICGSCRVVPSSHASRHCLVDALLRTSLVIRCRSGLIGQETAMPKHL